MKQQKIYEIAIIPIGGINNLINKEPTFSYFSNLKKCLETLQTSLAVNGWSHNINYTSVYRSINSKGKYLAEFKVVNNKVFRIVVIQKIINPNLTLLGIEENPTDS